MRYVTANTEICIRFSSLETTAMDKKLSLNEQNGIFVWMYDP